MFVSLSVDDIGIWKHVDLTRSGEVVGYPDLGDGAAFVDLGGGGTSTPASHIMVFMLTAVNDHFKLPCGWFAISEKFSGKRKYFLFAYFLSLQLFFFLQKEPVLLSLLLRR